jgi:hypothetical protein
MVLCLAACNIERREGPTLESTIREIGSLPEGEEGVKAPVEVPDQVGTSISFFYDCSRKGHMAALEKPLTESPEGRCAEGRQKLRPAPSRTAVEPALRAQPSAGNVWHI